MSTPPSQQPDELDTGIAGASARREGERRKANREKRVREKNPRTGGLRLALTDAPKHETVWGLGGGGEEHVAKLLAKHLNAGVVVLHDRGIPGSRANIDHIAIAPSGVWVIDTKRYKGKVAISKPLFGKAKLIIGGRDQTKLIDGLAKQVGLVEAVIAELAGDNVPVRGALCFVDSELPMLGKLSFNGYPLLHSKALAKRINAAGALAPDGVSVLARELAVRVPRA